MLWNPVFVAAVLAILAYGHYLLVRWLEKRYPSDRPITFTSDYKKVSVKKEDILYAFGTSTPTSMTVVATRSFVSPA